MFKFLSRLFEKKINIRREVHEGEAVQGWSTWFKCWGGWVGAAHSIEGGSGPPKFVSPETGIIKPGGLDVALYGVTLPKKKTRPPVVGERVTVYGYPAGSDMLSTRAGYVYIQRTPNGPWIIVFDDDVESVTGGMSGGAVVAESDSKIIGVLITRNYRADIDSDGDYDNSCDIVSLSDAWRAIDAAIKDAKATSNIAA